MQIPAALLLEDGSVFDGFSFGFPHSTHGEVVFTTAMAGYPQSLTDPSYCGQILVFTYPLIGNYGVHAGDLDEWGLPKTLESSTVHPRAVVVSEYCEAYSHWDATGSLADWLVNEKVPAMYGVDTRSLAVKLREKGVMLGRILVGDDAQAFNAAKTGAHAKTSFEDPNTENLVAKVSRAKPETFGKGRFHVVAVDCGIKNGLIRSLLSRDTRVTVVPWNYDFTTLDYDGLFLSNGPGDPSMCGVTIANVRKALSPASIASPAKPKPIFGVCLGNQILALAAGGKTYKLKYGHRGQNQPCVAGEKGYITSQNHGFAVDTKTLPKGWTESFFNANDGTNEGIQHETLPFYSVQFHPEGACGPQDTNFLFDSFVERMKLASGAGGKTK